MIYGGTSSTLWLVMGGWWFWLDVNLTQVGYTHYHGVSTTHTPRAARRPVK